MFHTTFNILGVLLIFPFNNRLACFLEGRFVSQEEAEGRPRYLDKTVIVSPILAINALALELSRMTTVVRRMGLEALSSEFIQSKNIRIDHIVAHKLSVAVSDFISRLERGVLGTEVSAQLTKVLRAEQHLLACGDQALLIAKMQASVEKVMDEKLMAELFNYRAEVVSLMEISNPENTDFSFADCELQLDRVQTTYDEVKASLLQAGVERRIAISIMMDNIDQNSRIRRMARQMLKAMHYLSQLSMIAGTGESQLLLSAAVSEEEQGEVISKP
jgi:phosphate:Na+ symporter